MIEFRQVHKRFRSPDGSEVEALRGLDLEIHPGELHCLLGTSGCGKTTALRLVNGLERADSGEVRVEGQAVAELDPIRLRRRIGYVVQRGGLFPHLDVAQNLGLLARLEGWPAQRIQERSEELLLRVGLPVAEFAGRWPRELSGGQAQRVAVARALMLGPQLILLDEPFAAVDPITRGRLHAELGEVLRAAEATVLMVTHDLDEAFALGDRISLMDQGQLRQTGTPAEIREQPADDFVATFVAAQAGRGAG